MNNIVITGRLTRDPEVKYSQSGKAIATFSVAVDRPFSKDKVTDFFDVVTFNKLAEVCGNNLAKGRRVLVDGVATMNSYTGKDGQKRSRFEIVANAVEFLDYNRQQGGSRNSGSAAGFESFGAAAQEEIDF